MATAAVAASSVDLTVPATYSIRLGDGIFDSAEHKSYTTIRYNHRPRIQHAQEFVSSIKAVRKNESELSLRDGEDEYGYSGHSTVGEDSYVLVLRGNGTDKEVVLERLAGSHTFNLASTPDETNAGRLKERYPQLNTQDRRLDLLDEPDFVEDGPAELDNPFDYRHFLKATAEAKSKRADTEAPRSSTGTPLAQHRGTSSTPLARPVKRTADSALVQQRKRKAPPIAAVDKANAKRAKPAAEKGQPPLSSAQKSTTAKPRPTPNTTGDPPPRIRVDRKASLRRPSYDDSGELILENDDTPAHERLPTGRSAMAMALNGQLGAGMCQGPISLRSAASSPASYVASPAPGRPGDEEGEEFEFDVDADGVEERRGRGEEFAVEEEDEDADVEDLELPSPATAHKPSVSAATVTGGDEDDLDAQLAAALGEEDGMGDGVVLDEEEESEEE